MLTGFHNETRGGSVTFLDLENISGRAPGLVKEFQCLSCPQRDPLAIFVMPRSDVVPVVAGREGTANVTNMVPIDQGVLSAGLYQTAFDGPLGRMEAVVNYHFDPHMRRVLDVIPGGGLPLLHDNLFKSGHLSHRFGRADVEALWSVLTWQDGTWATLPRNASRP